MKNVFGREKSSLRTKDGLTKTFHEAKNVESFITTKMSKQLLAQAEGEDHDLHVRKLLQELL